MASNLLGMMEEVIGICWIGDLLDRWCRMFSFFGANFYLGGRFDI